MIKSCTSCHGTKKKKGGFDFISALRKPGAPSARKQRNLVVANVTDHDMAPDDEKKQPTGEERDLFQKWLE